MIARLAWVVVGVSSLAGCTVSVDGVDGDPPVIARTLVRLNGDDAPTVREEIVTGDDEPAAPAAAPTPLVDLATCDGSALRIYDGANLKGAQLCVTGYGTASLASFNHRACTVQGCWDLGTWVNAPRSYWAGPAPGHFSGANGDLSGQEPFAATQITGVAGAWAQHATSVTLECPQHFAPGPTPTMIHSRVYHFYWGSAFWDHTSGGVARQVTHDQNWTTLTTDPRFLMPIKEYTAKDESPGMKLGLRFAGSWVQTTRIAGVESPPTSGTSLTLPEIWDELRYEVEHLPPSARFQDGYTPLYVVLLPPGVTAKYDDDNGSDAHHTWITASDGTRIYYALVESYLSQAALTQLESHEVYEFITDPDVAGGWMDGNQEIGDTCNGVRDTLDGITIQKVFSQKACRCIGASTFQVPPPGTID
jgi:hypothetical protein